MKKLLMFGVLLFSLSSCLDTDDDNKVTDRLLPFESATVASDTVAANQKFYAHVKFSYQLTCESLYSQYYYSVNDFDRVIAPIAQVRLNKECTDSTNSKTITDSIPFKFKTPGTYTLHFYKGKKDGSDSADFFKHKIVVENN